MNAREINQTLGLRPADSERIAEALDGAPEFVAAAFRAMVKAGIYDAGEMVDRIHALRAMAK